jgi:hypothetical protein
MAKIIEERFMGTKLIEISSKQRKFSYRAKVGSKKGRTLNISSWSEDFRTYTDICLGGREITMIKEILKRAGEI